MKEKHKAQQDMYRKALLDPYTNVSVLDAGLAGLGPAMKGTVCHTMGSGSYYIMKINLSILRRSNFGFGLIIRAPMWKKNWKEWR